MTTLLGFDFGPRKIGVAVGQTLTGSATPLTTIRSRRDKPDWPRIESLVRDWNPAAAVVGLPFNMDDTEVDWCDQVRRFARQLQGRFGLPVHEVDERYTTTEALAAGAADADAAAAALILEQFLREIK